jgi:protein-disulfide isomerase
VFREFPLNVKDVACSMIARRIASDDSGKYFAVVDMQFRQQDALFEKTKETLQQIGKQAGLSQQAVEDCLKDQTLMNKIVADRNYAQETLKVEGTPTFFINGEMIAGEMSFDEIDAKIKPLLKT